MKSLRTNFVCKVVTVYLVMFLIMPQAFMPKAYALTGGPSQPEFNSFTPIETSNMVNLSTGDFNYNIPIMDVGGYPLNLSYDSGVTMDQEASWVGLGWNLNVGQINRNVRGLPDDFDGSAENGDLMTYENNFKDNVTIGGSFGIGVSIFGTGESDVLEASIGLGVQYNNYNGISFNPTFGLSYSLSESVSIGMNISGSATNGATVSPSISLGKKLKSNADKSINASLGASFNSRQSLSSLNVSGSVNKKFTKNVIKDDQEKTRTVNTGYSLGSSYSFNDLVLFTPTKRVGTKSTNLTFNAAIGPTAFGFSGQGKISGYGSIQKIQGAEKLKNVKAFGYDNTEKNEALNDGVLDFNREKDRPFSKNTTLLPIVNYTYDMYSINGQGIGGAFRPYRSQIGYVNDPTTKDKGTGGSFGGEFEAGWVFAGGVDVKISDTKARTGLWTKRNKNFALGNFTKSDLNSLDYEKIYYRTIGELNVDNENYESVGLFRHKLKGSDPIHLKVTGNSKYNRSLKNEYLANPTNSSPSTSSVSIPLLNNEKLQRDNRLLRNQSIQKIKVSEVTETRGSNPFIEVNPHAKQHHTGGFSIIKPDGSNYIYGKTAYNITKREATFAVTDNGDCTTGLVGYSGNDNSVGNKKGRDRFFNRVTTPAYAHTYLLTSILSADYEDLTGNGPSDDDLGAYTRFNYRTPYTYKWRMPFEQGQATANRGFYSEPQDQKGNYIYGEREQVYIRSIETKTHIAFFEISSRKDALGVGGENGGSSGGETSEKIDKIKLFSKKEYYEKGAVNAVPIKTAHFEYSYTLCPGVPNSNAENGGKLTLEKVYFTYQNSNMGAFMPYTFKYGEVDSNEDGVIDDSDSPSNPVYNIKGYDIWGNYKENKGDCEVTSNAGPTNSEFPYVEQEKEIADTNTVAWTLTSVGLPSGGDLQIEYESDDYQYVQDKKIMQLYDVTGAGSDPDNDDKDHTRLYSGSNVSKYIYVKIPENQSIYEANDFVEELSGEPVFFKFLVQMTKNSSTNYDYVSGYFNIDNNSNHSVQKVGSHLAIPVEFVNIDRNGDANPISKAGWFFGRQNMNQLVYSTGGYSDNQLNNPVAIIQDLVGSIGSVFEIFKGPNKVLKDKGVAKEFKAKKSWVRLMNPTKKKFGGGARVKKLQMDDNWDVMTNHDNNTLYQKFYGQVYSYNLEDDSSSGVATFEPNGSKENPFVLPFYDKSANSNKDKILAPKETNFVEKPIGESFFPSPTVTYGRVTVQNLPHENIKMHATGKVVSEFYTSRDFPTITDYTELDSNSLKYDAPSTLSQLLNFSVKTHATVSQGFSIEINDMNGKQKAQWIYAENGESPLSGVEYKYYLEENGTLKNKLPVIDKIGQITEQLIGVNYDVINDFRESRSESTTYGVNVNFGGFIIAIIPYYWVVPIPSYAHHENVLHTATTTKVIQKHGILKEKIAHDLGARVSTQNLAWDANTGEVLATKTINDFDDSYFSLNYPAYWKNEGMGTASINLGLEGRIASNLTGSLNLLDENNLVISNPEDYLIPGDELYTYIPSTTENAETFYEKLWVLSITGNELLLMDRYGKIVNECPDDDERNIDSLNFKVMRSGYRNIQAASMASITTKVDPVYNPETNNLRVSIPSFTDVNPSTYKIINASAVEYSDFWKTQRESGVPYFTVGNIYNEDLPMVDGNGNIIEDLNETQFLHRLDKFNINPYVYNIKGDWKARRSWAYLTGRQQSTNPNLKDDGYLTSFTPFYTYNAGKWQINGDAVVENSTESVDKRWTFASEVTQYSPYGTELENKDALNRYSSAQYGHNYTLPTAVASNSEYREMGFEGFEDSEKLFYTPKGGLNHFSFGQAEVVSIEDSEIVHDIAHTGRKSIKVNPGKSVTLTRSFSDYNPEEIEDCEDLGGEPGGLDCEDLSIVSVIQLNTTTGTSYSTAFRLNSITPTPNLTVSLSPAGTVLDCDIYADNDNQQFTYSGGSNCSTFISGTDDTIIVQMIATISINGGESCQRLLTFQLVND